VIPKDAIVNALRSLKFRYKDQTERIEIWKQAGSTRRVEIRRHDLHDDIAVRVILRQAGMSAGDIELFIQNNTRRKH
jgi:hypothetical protein